MEHKLNKILSEHVDVASWGLNSDEAAISEQIKYSLRDAHANLPILWRDYGSDGYGNSCPYEATTIYLTLFLGEFSDSNETIVSISLKNLADDMIPEAGYKSLESFKSGLQDIISKIDDRLNTEDLEDYERLKKKLEK